MCVCVWWLLEEKSVLMIVNAKFQYCKVQPNSNAAIGASLEGSAYIY